jgi:dTDP-4-dehydrorhamnose reductase
MATAKTKVWITGAGGLIGHACVAVAPSHRQAVGLTRTQADLTDFAAVEARFRAEQPAAILHCAAMSKSPACQRDPAGARRHNVEVTRHLAGLAADRPFLFLSTDLVFDGLRGNYVETDALNPLSVYAETKVAAEEIVLANPRHTVARTSLNFGTSPTGDRAFNEEMLVAWRAGRKLTLFTDEFRCPIPAVETAAVLWALLGLGITGVVHVAGRERLSRFDLGRRVAEFYRREAQAGRGDADWAELAMEHAPESLVTYVGAPRAPDTSLDCARVESLLGRPMPEFSRWLATAHWPTPERQSARP